MEEFTTQERVKVLDRPDIARRWEQSAKELAESANNLLELYKDLQLGEFTAETLADVYETGGAKARRLYVNAVKEDAAKIRSHAIQMQMIQEAEEWRTPFADAARQAKREAEQGGGEERFLLKFLTLDGNGLFTLTDEAKQAIIDKSAIYLTDPEEITKYRQHLAAVEALNAFFEDGKTMPIIWYSLFEVGENGSIKTPSAGTNYAYLLNLRNREEQGNTPRGENAEQPTPQHTKEIKQYNRASVTAPAMVKGIAKEPNYTDRGAEMRLKNPLDPKRRGIQDKSQNLGE